MQPASGPHEDKHLELAEDAFEQQKQINKIITKAVQFIRNGQQKEAIRELAKEELNTIADPKTKSEILALVAKLFPPAAPNELLPSRPEDAPRVIVSPDEAFKQWLNKAVRKIKASGIDGISTQALPRALQAEDDAVAFIAKMIERIINAEVEGTELEALSSLLLVLLPKKDKGMRPVAIANTIVRMAKAYALFLGEKSSLRSSRKTNYNKEPLPPDRKESSTQ
jgi:hypothetical protein